MKRIGLTKDQVKQARDILLAQEKYPSVDAVRIELGNTGSKSTIHKYLKELDDEQPQEAEEKLTISETIQNLILSLSQQLEKETQIQVIELKNQHQEQIEKLNQQLQNLEQRFTEKESILQEKLKELDLTHQINEQLKQKIEQKQQENIEIEQNLNQQNQIVQQQQADLIHAAEKFQHLQDTLNHYRESVKEQRQQDLRRHDHQLQMLQAEMRQLQQTIVIKQDNLNELSLKHAKLVAEFDLLTESNHKLTLSTNEKILQNKEIDIKNNELELELEQIKHQLNINESKQEQLALENMKLKEKLATEMVKYEVQKEMLAEFKQMILNKK